MARKNISLTAKTMGISTPIIARGVNPHEPIRQSALTLDGPAIDTPMIAHELVLVDAAPNGVPGFSHLPTIAGISDYASNRGFSGVSTLQDFVDKFASRFGLVWYGSEQAEMNMLGKVIGDDSVECEYNNVVVLKDAYITRVILPAVSQDFADSVIIGGCLKLVKLNDGVAAGNVVLTASYTTAPTDEDGNQIYDTTVTGNIVDIPGTTVVNAGRYVDNDGHTFTTIDFVC